MKKNNTIDIAAWGLVLVVLIAVPLIVTSFYTAPELGPAKNPSVFIMFLTLLGFITLTTLASWAQIVMGRTRSISNRSALSNGTINTLNLQNKLIGALFIVSGFVKLQDPLGFSYKLDDYWSVFQEYTGFFPAEFFSELSVGMAMFISVFEVVLAFALMTGFKIRIASFLALAMVVFFTFLTGFSAITGAVTDCGCFGDALKLTPVQTFEKDILLTFAILPIYLLRKRIRPYYRTPIPAVLVGLSTVVFGYISFHTLNHLPLIDFRGAYAAGQDLNYNSTTFDEEDQLIAHDFYDFCTDCGKGKNGLSGPTLYVVCYGMEKHSLEPYQEAIQLAKTIAQKAPGLKVCSASDTPGSIRKGLGLDELDELCMSSQDSKMLKTMIRSSPGFVLLKNGVIQEKWHHNDMPSVETLIEMAGPEATQAPTPPPPPPVEPDTTQVDSGAVDSLVAPLEGEPNS